MCFEQSNRDIRAFFPGQNNLQSNEKSIRELASLGLRFCYTLKSNVLHAAEVEEDYRDLLIFRLCFEANFWI